MQVYLAGPIAGCTDEQAHGWRDEVKEKLDELGIGYFDPMARDFRNNGAKDHMAEIVEGDLEEIDKSNVLLANVWQVSAGTSMEIFYSSHVRGIPVISVFPKEAMVPVWIRYHSTVVRNMDTAVQLIKDVRDLVCHI